MSNSDVPLNYPECQRWRKSSFSHPNGNECVEVKRADSTVQIRDSKDLGHGPTVDLHLTAWACFLDDVTNGTSNSADVGIEYAQDGSVQLIDADRTTTLQFTSAEWAAFRKGVLAGEFSYHLALA